MIEETKYAGDEYSKGSCLATGICTHPFVPIELKEDGSEVCLERTIKDFQFPYWWGAPNVGFAYPESCGAPGSAPSADSCQEREDADPGTEEPLAGWHLCDAAAAKSMSIVISAVDDTGTKPVETVDLQAKVTVR